ncbi:MAG: hypothetical protein HY693_01425 [Deltaproteobacteria bacterium]|nr:hypothetical protein [Deltaproteobacteria bacterium]
MGGESLRLTLRPFGFTQGSRRQAQDMDWCATLIVAESFTLPHCIPNVLSMQGWKTPPSAPEMAHNQSGERPLQG